MASEIDGLDEADAKLIEQLRALPDQGREPDWVLLERSIREAVAEAPLVPWWRRWRWIVPIGGLALAAAAALFWLRPAGEVAPPQTATTKLPVEHAVPAIATPAAQAPAAVWLDDGAVELDQVDDTMFDDLDRDARDALGGDMGAVTEGILPTGDLHWIDDLDEASIERVEHWLERKKT